MVNDLKKEGRHLQYTVLRIFQSIMGTQRIHDLKSCLSLPALVIYWCITILPPNQQLKTTHIYFLTISVESGAQAWLNRILKVLLARDVFSSEGLAGERYTSSHISIDSIQFLVDGQNEGLGFLLVASSWLPSIPCPIAFFIGKFTTWQAASSKLTKKGVAQRRLQSYVTQSRRGILSPLPCYIS